MNQPRSILITIGRQSLDGNLAMRDRNLARAIDLTERACAKQLLNAVLAVEQRSGGDPAIGVHVKFEGDALGLLRLETVTGELQGSAVLGDGTNSVVVCPVRKDRLSLERYPHLGAVLTHEVGDHFFRDATGVTANPGRVERHRSMEPLWGGGRARGLSR